MDYKKILKGVVDIINNTEKSDIGFANICSYIGENCPELKEGEDDEERVIKTFNLIMSEKGLTSFPIDVPIELADANVKEFANIVKEMTTLYARKNHDYGNSFDEGCNKIGASYALCRLLDKLNRLIACMGKEDTMQVNESIEDTLKDLACYSVMTLSYLRRNETHNNKK